MNRRILKKHKRTAVTVDPDIQFGHPVFTGTRVPVWCLFVGLGRSGSGSVFQSDHPNVPRWQVREVLRGRWIPLPTIGRLLAVADGAMGPAELFAFLAEPRSELGMGRGVPRNGIQAIRDGDLLRVEALLRQLSGRPTTSPRDAQSSSYQRVVLLPACLG